MSKKGKVYLVGAGPGDPELLTIKARRLIGEADAILFDALLGDGIKALFPSRAKLIDVGKRADAHTYPQEEISRMLVKLAGEYDTVIRLKGGDPYVFGRGGEEAEELARHGIDFEAVPGITSAIAVPASACIPVTHRGLSSSFTVITGHEDPSKNSAAVDYQSLARAGGTLVFLMGVSNLENIANALVTGGASPDTPVAIIEKGTTPGQRTTTGTLSDIAARARERKVEAPAVIVVGPVVRMREVLCREEKSGSDKA